MVLHKLMHGLFLTSILVVALSATAFAEGTITYTLHKSANPTADEQDAYKRITTVMDSAVKLYNTYSNLSKFINVYYAPGVPTAEASSNGDLRFGEKRSYMVVPTAMHEMAHTLGIGTTSEYWAACPTDIKVFQNDKVQAKLRELSGKQSDELHCDNQHIWPYGLNQASEVKSEKDLIIHVQLVEFIYQQLFKEAFYKQGRVKSVSEGKCMGITSSNALELMDCGDTATFVKIFSMGDNNVTYRFQLGSRVVDIPNESTAAGIVASTYGYNGGAHQKDSFEAPANMPNTFLFKNAKSGLYLQAVGKQVQQNRKVDRDESFMWKIEEAVLAPDTSKQDTTVAPKDTSDTNATDTGVVAIKRVRDAQDLMMRVVAPKRVFDLKGRSVHRQPLGRTRNTHKVLFRK